MASPLILVTNDDGVYAPGVRALFEAMRSLGDAVKLPDMQGVQERLAQTAPALLP